MTYQAKQLNLEMRGFFHPRQTFVFEGKENQFLEPNFNFMQQKCGLQGYHTNFVIRGFFRLG
jgi:hypothetical protein